MRQELHTIDLCVLCPPEVSKVTNEVSSARCMFNIFIIESSNNFDWWYRC